MNHHEFENLGEVGQNTAKHPKHIDIEVEESKI